MYAHTAEVEAEARLKEGEIGGDEWLTGRAQNLVDKRRGFGVRGLSAGGGTVGLLLQNLFLLLAARTFALVLDGRGPAGLDLHGTGGGHVGDAHAHHLVRNGVGLRLPGVVEGANPELSLNERRT
jgi:hypothetical protein